MSSRGRFSRKGETGLSHYSVRTDGTGELLEPHP